MTVVKPGIIPDKVYRGICPNCGCVVEDEIKPLRWWERFRITAREVPCPTCKKWKIILWVEKKSKELT